MNIKIGNLNNTIKLINKENIELKSKNKELKQKNKELKQENIKLKELLENEYYEEDYDDENDFYVNKK